MSTLNADATKAPYRLRTSRVVRVEEQRCGVWSGGDVSWVRFAAPFPAPRVERVSPGHLVAIATGPIGTDVVIWRWYDAVVLGPEGDGLIRLWEPAHGEVIARARPTYAKQDPGTRAYASCGLPGAEWWVAGPVAGAGATAAVDLDEVYALYSQNGLWSAAFDVRP